MILPPLIKKAIFSSCETDLSRRSSLITGQKLWCFNYVEVAAFLVKFVAEEFIFMAIIVEKRGRWLSFFFLYFVYLYLKLKYL